MKPLVSIDSSIYYHKKKNVAKDYQYKTKNDKNDRIKSDTSDKNGINIDNDIMDNDYDNDSNSGGGLLKGLVIERLGSRMLVEVINATTTTTSSSSSSSSSIPLQLTCYQKSKLYEEMLVVGDNVILKIDENSKHTDTNDNTTTITSNIGIIINKSKRRNLLARPSPIGGRGLQMKAIAANIDQIVIVVSLSPVVPPLSTDRYLIAAKEYDLNAIILLNKCDLDGAEQFIQDHDHYKSLGYKVLTLSTKQYSNDIETLKNELANKTSIFVGQSGVGKSSLLNTLLPDANIKVGELMITSGTSQLGSHTTSSSRLYHLNSGGNVIDSPGIREFGLWNLPQSSVKSGFFEIEEFSKKCKYRNCKHDEEGEENCAVLSALTTQDIHPQRLINYYALLDNL
jgi:ribosome biogenesis GTPase